MNCMVCGAIEIAEVTRTLRHDEPGVVLRCEACGLVFLQVPEVEQIDYSAQEYRKKYGPVVGRASTPEEMFRISLPAQRQRVDRVRSLLGPEVSVLEVGCSTGYFLQAIRPLVRSVVGVEPNPEHASYAKRELGLEVICDTLERASLEGRTFDRLFLFQVLEHIPDPITFLERCRGLIKPGGCLYLEVPNHRDALLGAYGSPAYRKFFYRRPHLYYFTSESLVRLMAKAGVLGVVSSAQCYSFFNHVHWVQQGRPQESLEQGYAIPSWPGSPGDGRVSDLLRRFMEKVDRDYRTLLSVEGVGDVLCFTGSPA